MDADNSQSRIPPVTKACDPLILKLQWFEIVTGKSFPSSEPLEVMSSVDFKVLKIYLEPPMMSAWLGLICGAEAANLTVPMVVEGIHMALGNKVLILLYYSRADTYLILNPTFSAFRNGMAFKYLMAALVVFFSILIFHT